MDIDGEDHLTIDWLELYPWPISADPNLAAGKLPSQMVFDHARSARGCQRIGMQVKRWSAVMGCTEH